LGLTIIGTTECISEAIILECEDMGEVWPIWLGLCMRMRANMSK
jgi:hypothetical protein